MEDPLSPIELKEKEKVNPEPAKNIQKVNRIEIRNVEAAIVESGKLDKLVRKMAKQDMTLNRIARQLVDRAGLWKRSLKTKKEKENKDKFYRKVKSWNKKVCRVRQAEKATEEEKNLPTINTKPRHAHSKVAKSIQELVANADGENQQRIISICSHGNHNKKPCWLVTSEELAEKIKRLIDDSNQWVYVDSKKIVREDFIKKIHTYNEQQLMKRIGFKCQGEKKDCCDHPRGNRCLQKDRKTCGSVIKMSKIVQYLETSDKEIFTKDLLYKIITTYFQKNLNKKIAFCPNEACKWSTIGLIKEDNYGYGYNRRYYNWCGQHEQPDWHKMTCHCGNTFCDLCKKLHYHPGGDVCPGPIHLVK